MLHRTRVSQFPVLRCLLELPVRTVKVLIRIYVLYMNINFNTQVLSSNPPYSCNTTNMHALDVATESRIRHFQRADLSCQVALATLIIYNAS